MNWNDLRLRMRALTLRKRVEQELDEELGFHLEMETRKNAAVGVDETEALRLARIRFGGLDQVKEECRSFRGTLLLDTIVQDVCYALKSFRRSPVLVVTVVGTIALGLGINTALFTVCNAYVLRPLSIRDPYSLYCFTCIDRAGDSHAFSWREFESLRTSNTAFSEVAAERFLYARIDGHPMMGALVTGNYFQMLGVNALLGRTLFPADSPAPGGQSVVVLAYSAWKNRFAGDPNIIGRKLALHGYPFEVIGVTKQGFDGLGEAPREYWAPITMQAQLDDGPNLFGPERPKGINEIVGRLRLGLNTAQAKAALTVWSQQITADRPDPEKAVGAILTRRATAVSPTLEMVALFSPLLVAFGLVLLLACANVANMMLARALARQREIGTRLSLGASRRRLIRQLLTESILLAIPAGLAGFVIAQVMVQFSLRLMFATLPSDMAEFITTVPMSPDARVFAFMLGAALISAVLFGLVPAIQATRNNVMLAARGEFTTDVRPQRFRNMLVIGQITASVLLLICAGVLIHAADRMRNFELGYKTGGVIIMEIEEKFRLGIIDRLNNEPIVETMAAAVSTPLNGMLPTIPVSTVAGEVAPSVWYDHVSPEYFHLLEIPILWGRNFTADEARSRAEVAIVSEATARRLWPNRDAVGQEIRIQDDTNTGWVNWCLSIRLSG
jgi:predicted permease